MVQTQQDADTNTLYRYNVAANTYDTLASSSTASWAQAAAYLNGKIYRIGGCVTGCSGSLSTVEAYTISTNTWAAAAPLPQHLGWLMAVGYNGYVWVAGGTVPADSAKTYRYDAAANTWDDAAMPDLPGTRWGSASDIVGGKWLLAGGYAGAAPSNTNVAFNFATNTWDTPPPLPIAKARWAGGTAGTRFAAPGGRGAAGGFTGTNETQVYTVPPCGTATATVTGTPPT